MPSQAQYTLCWLCVLLYEPPIQQCLYYVCDPASIRVGLGLLVGAVDPGIRRRFRLWGFADYAVITRCIVLP
jgi:hypothetical protein